MAPRTTWMMFYPPRPCGDEPQMRCWVAVGSGDPPRPCGDEPTKVGHRCEGPPGQEALWENSPTRNRCWIRRRCRMLMIVDSGPESERGRGSGFGGGYFPGGGCRPGGDGRGPPPSPPAWPGWWVSVVRLAAGAYCVRSARWRRTLRAFHRSHGSAAIRSCRRWSVVSSWGSTRPRSNSASRKVRSGGVKGSTIRRAGAALVWSSVR